MYYVFHFYSSNNSIVTTFFYLIFNAHIYYVFILHIIIFIVKRMFSLFSVFYEISLFVHDKKEPTWYASPLFYFIHPFDYLKILLQIVLLLILHLPFLCYCLLITKLHFQSHLLVRWLGIRLENCIFFQHYHFW